jgi:hypothetical protein
MEVLNRRKRRRYDQARIGSLIAVAFVVAIGGVAIYLFLNVIGSPGFFHVLSGICADDPTCHVRLQIFIVFLLIPLVFLPVGWFITLRASWLRSVQFGHGNAAEFFLSLTTITVPFFVLALGMLLELRKITDAVNADSVDAIGAIAGIMILYTLTLLGGFVFETLTKTRNEIQESFRTASTWLATQQRLANSKGHYSPAPAEPVQRMLAAWADVYDHAAAGTKAAGREQVDRVRTACISTLLWTYANEECKDLGGQLPRDRVPPQLWPSVLGESAAGKASFIATNVGYYASFLENAVPRLREIGKSGFKPTLAIVTGVLPLHWWNWPYDRDQYAVYDPVLRYWNAQQLFTENDGEVYRRILVADHTGKEHAFLRRSNDAEVLALVNDSWRMLMDPEDPDGAEFPLRSGGPAISEWPGRVLTAGGLTAEQQNHVVNPLRHALAGNGNTRPVYWVLAPTGGEECYCQLPGGRKHGAKSCLQPVSDVYRRLLHKRGGKTEIIKTDVEKHFDRRMLDASGDPAAVAGLEGCSDIMFLGLTKGDAWTDNGAQWGCALLASMGPGTETMFLTVIYSELEIYKLWNCVRRALDFTPLGPGAPARPYDVLRAIT